jgi:hypothetical protein
MKRRLRLQFVVKVQCFAFALALALTSHSWLRVIVDGPYGGVRLQSHWNRMQSYDAVTLFATDIGIAGQLPYVRELLRYFIDEERSMTERGRGLRKHQSKKSSLS